MARRGAGPWRIPFRISLLLLTLGLVVATSAAIVFGVYAEGRRVAAEQAAVRHASAAAAVAERLEGLVNVGARLVELGAAQGSALGGVEGAGAPPPDALLDLLGSLLEASPELYSAYHGRDDGSFVQVIAVRDDDALQRVLDAPPGTTQVQRQVFDDAPSGTRIDRRRHVDAAGQLLGQSESAATFDPRVRPWYLGAMHRGSTFLTPPYVYDSTGRPGITLAHPATGGGVLGVDLTIDGLQDFLATHRGSPGSRALVFDGGGTLWAAHPLPGGAVAGTAIGAQTDAHTARLLQRAQQGSQLGEVRPAGDEVAMLDYVSHWQAPAGISVFIAMTAPLSDFTDFLAQAVQRVLWHLLMVMLVAVPLIVVAAQTLSQPLHRLTAAARRIAAFDFSTDHPQRSAITEIDSLGVSFAGMTQALRSHNEALNHAHGRLEMLVEFGIALSSERDPARLVESILLGAKQIARADGGTLYLRTLAEELEFSTMFTDSLGIALGGSTGRPIELPPVPLRDADGGLNHAHIAAEAVHSGQPVNIEDAYTAQGYDFSGTRAFDKNTGYRSVSLLAVPMKNRQGHVIGVLQLLNAREAGGEAVCAFAREVEGVVMALASQAAVALENALLLREQKALMDAFIQLVAGAIDAKSPYTGGHCNRVPELARMLAEAACAETQAPFAEYRLNADEWYEFHIAAWLHDCGKVTTPEYVVDKATKLETIYNRIHEVRTRFEVLIRDAQVHYWQQRSAGGDAETLAAQRDRSIDTLREEFAFIARSNIGGEAMSAADQARVANIAARSWWRHLDDRLGLSADEMRRRSDGAEEVTLPVRERLLDDKPWHIVPRQDGGRPWGDNPHGFKMAVPEHLYNHGERYNLSIARGTLTAEERFKINDHIVQTIIMLGQLPFPPQMARVPEIAGGHHETMLGTGYPRGLHREQMSVSARIMAIADIFEALTAADRPYKKAKPLSESLRIMAAMRDAGHIDPDLFALFLRAGVHQRYADTFLEPEQHDEVDIQALLAGPGGAPTNATG